MMTTVKSNNREDQEDSNLDFGLDNPPKWQQGVGKLLKPFSHAPFLPKT
jgi:hypothetical protein